MKSKKFSLWCMIGLLTGIWSCHASIPNGWNLPALTLSDYLVGYTVVVDSLSMAMDSEGNALAVWKAKFGSSIFILFARFEAATNSWNSSIKAFEIFNIPAPVILRMNQAGDAFVMWQDQQVPDYILMCTKFTNGTSWASWFPLVYFLANDSQLPLYECAINEAGDALFVFSSGTNYASKFYDHTIAWIDWAAGPVTATIDPLASTLELALDVSDNCLAVYKNLNQELFAAQYDGSWHTPTQISSVGAQVSLVDLLPEPVSTQQYIMWVEDNTLVKATQFGQTSKTLDSLVTLTVGNIKQIMDASGNVTFMWTANGTTSGAVKTTYFNNSTWNSWSPVINTIAASASAPITHWTLAAQPVSPYQVFALWEIFDGAQYIVQANQSIAGAWIIPATQQVFLLANNRATDPQLGVDASGNAIALWGQAADQISVTKILISAIWYDAAKLLWQDKTTILSNSCYCNCA